MLLQKGCELDIRRPRFGDPLPETMDNHAGAIIFGGPMSANDPDDFIKQEIDWCGVPLKENAPFLGVCLGAQMLVKHMGGTVETHPEGMVEIGYYPIQDLQNSQDTAFPELPSHMYQWHKEGFDLPEGCIRTASSDSFENQAFYVKETNAYGVQFHTELTLAMLHRWTVVASERLVMPGAKTRGEHMQGRFVYDPPIKTWLDTFLDNWLETDTR